MSRLGDQSLASKIDKICKFDLRYSSMVPRKRRHIKLNVVNRLRTAELDVHLACLVDI